MGKTEITVLPNYPITKLPCMGVNIMREYIIEPDNIPGRLSNIEGILSQHGQQLSKLTTIAEQHGQQLLQHEEQSVRIETILERMVGEMRDRFERMETDMREMKNRMEQKFDSIEGRIDRLYRALLAILGSTIVLWVSVMLTILFKMK